MAEQKNNQPDGTKQVGQGGGLNLKAKDAPAESIQAPLEIASQGKGIQIVKEGDEITIRFSPLIAQEIGAYRKTKVGVKFKEGGQLQFILEAEA